MIGVKDIYGDGQASLDASAEGSAAEAGPVLPDGGRVDAAGATAYVVEPEGYVPRWLRQTSTQLVWVSKQTNGKDLVRTTDKIALAPKTVAAPDGGLETNGNSVNGIVTDGQYAYALVYETECRNAVRYDLTTNAATYLSYACGEARALAQEGSFLYFVNFRDVPFRVVEVPKTTFADRVFAVNEEGIELCAASKWVYLTQTSGTRIRRALVAPDAGPHEDFATGLASAQSLVCDDELVTWATSDGRIQQLAHSTPGAAPAELAKDQASPSALVVRGKEIWFATEIPSRSEYQLRKLTVGSPPVVVWSAPQRIDSFVVADDAIYVATPLLRTIWRVPQN